MSKKILIVEDNELNAKLLTQYLKHKGYTTFLLDNGNDVLELTLKERPDLILMDIDIFGISGVDACENVRSDHHVATTPIVAVTSYSKYKVIDEMNGTKFNDYVQKPIIFTEFQLILERYASII